MIHIRLKEGSGTKPETVHSAPSGRRYAPGFMGSPEVPRLRRRVEEQDDTITALSDTLIEVKEVVDGHTATLAEHGRALGEIQATQAQQSELLAEILRRLPS